MVEGSFFGDALCDIGFMVISWAYVCTTVFAWHIRECYKPQLEVTFDGSFLDLPLCVVQLSHSCVREVHMHARLAVG